MGTIGDSAAKNAVVTERLAHLERQIDMLDDIIGCVMREVAIELSTANSPHGMHARTEKIRLMNSYIKFIGADLDETKS